MLETELLQVSLGIRRCLSRTYTDGEWDRCLVFADKQAILGVLWAGIEVLPKEQSPYKDLLMEWMGQTERLQTRSDEMNRACTRVYHNFKSAGFESVILKGQSNAKLYGGKLLRTPGDIDIWLFAPRDLICRYLRENVPSYSGEHEGKLHTEFHWRDVTLEVHFTATYLTVPKYDRRLSVWLEAQSRELKTLGSKLTDGFPSPTLEFNLVYLILHMYRHYLFEGIGLRHVVDYYLVLQKSTAMQRRAAFDVLQNLGAERFAAALMWVLAEGFDLNAEIWLCQPDTWRGRMLWNAIMDGGNFGKADKMNSEEYRRWGWKRLWRFVKRNVSMFAAYPNEIGWHILGRVFCF